jgi:serine/threonine-protein kinase
MELLEGETLEAAIERRGRLSIGETAEVGRQVGRVLAKAHDLGIAHRDIKPDNLILIEGEMEPFVKVIDFGIAKSGDDAGRITTAGIVMGTPQYMSPEQLAGYDVGAETDLWALGVIAYLCLTGSLPFEGDDMVSVATSMAEDQVAPPSLLCDDLPRSLDAWFQRIFDPNPNLRFPSARALLAALEAALAQPDQGPVLAARALAVRLRRAPRYRATFAPLIPVATSRSVERDRFSFRARSLPRRQAIEHLTLATASVHGGNGHARRPGDGRRAIAGEQFGQFARQHFQLVAR